MQNDRELRAALEQAQAALASARRELERTQAEQASALAKVDAQTIATRRQLERLERDHAEALTKTRELEQVRRERDAFSHQLERARRHAAAAERDIIMARPDVRQLPDESVEAAGPGLGRWLVRSAGVFLVGAYLGWGESLCGLFLGGGLLVVSFLD